MAAPSSTAITSPGGIKLEDGYSSVFAFALDPDVSLWEITVQPTGRDGGEKISTTTMRNTLWRTYAPRSLIDATDAVLTFAYDPNLRSQIISLLNTPGSITQWWPDLSSEDFYGYIKDLMFDPLEEGKMPTGKCTVVCTNFDPVNRVEQGPVFNNVAGT